MKKNIHLTLIFILTAYKVVSQTPYHDALALRALDPQVHNGIIFFNDNDSTFQILGKYTDSPDYAGISNDFKKNPFLRLPNEAELSSRELPAILKSVVSNIPGVDVTTFVDGFAKFLVKRTKEELNVAFFSRMKNVFYQYPEFSALFPRTADIIREIDEVNYSSFLQVFKEAYEFDVINLVGRIPELRDLSDCECDENKCQEVKKQLIEDISKDCKDYSGSQKRYCNCLKRKTAIEAFFTKEEGYALWSVSIIGDQLIRGKNIADALNAVFEVEDLREVADIKGISYNSLKLLDLFSSSFRDQGRDRIWVSAQNVQDNILNDRIALKIYLGLVYQQSKNRNIQFNIAGKKLEFHHVLDSLGKNEELIIKTLKDISLAAQDIDNNLAEIKQIKKDDKKVDILLINQYLTGINNLFENGISLLKWVTVVDVSNKDLVKGLSGSLSSLNRAVGYASTIVSGIEQKNYSTVLFNSYLIMQNYLTDTEFRFKDKFLTYGTFIATVAQAQNSDQVAEAIEAAVLPSGSSIVKRKSSFNVALNAYVGPFGGWEKLVNPAEGMNNDRSFVAGIAAPIGAAVSWGGWNCWVQGVTVFTSLIDLGAVTAYRFNNDNNSEGLPDIKLKDIIAPGAQLFINFRNTPLSLGGGYQLGPLTRSFETMGNGEVTTTRSEAHRWTVNILVDVPLINFYTKPK